MGVRPGQYQNRGRASAGLDLAYPLIRRTAAADPWPALRLLLSADGPKAITRGGDADARALVQAKQEVREAMDAARN